MAENHTPQPGLRILVVDDEVNIRMTLALHLEAEGHHVVSHGNIHDALAEASWQAFDLIFLDLRLGTDNGLDFIPRLRAENSWAQIVVITAYASIDTAVEAMKRGARDYLPKPFTPAQVQLITQRVAQQRLLERQVESLQAALDGMDPEADMPTSSTAMRRSVELARQLAGTQATLLIRGEIGTGKGRLARAIHSWSSRSHGPFSTVSCQTTNAEALDAELFGLSTRESGGNAGPGEFGGRVELSAGGTLVLDEIGAVPPSLQAKLLRLMHDKEFERLNDFKTRQASVRIIATTSMDLAAAVKRGRFRADLLAACDAGLIDIPPLRQRGDDVQLLALRYLAYFCRENRRQITGFTPDALAALNKHVWPGNVRELRNVIERAVMVCREDRIGIEHLPPDLLHTPSAYNIGDLVPLETIEELHIRKVVAATKSIGKAAAILGVHPGTVVRRMRRYRQDPPGNVTAAPSTEPHDLPAE